MTTPSCGPGLVRPLFCLLMLVAGVACDEHNAPDRDAEAGVEDMDAGTDGASEELDCSEDDDCPVGYECKLSGPGAGGDGGIEDGGGEGPADAQPGSTFDGGGGYVDPDPGPGEAGTPEAGGPGAGSDGGGSPNGGSPEAGTSSNDGGAPSSGGGAPPPAPAQKQFSAMGMCITVEEEASDDDGGVASTGELACVGSATSCRDIASRTRCHKQEGCRWDHGDWDDLLDGDCRGSADSCREFDAEIDCGNQSGCRWE